MQYHANNKEAVKRAEDAKIFLAQKKPSAVPQVEPESQEVTSTPCPNIPGPQVSKEQAFEVISRVRQRIKVARIKESSVIDYKSKAKHLLSLAASGEVLDDAQRWISSLDGYAGQTNSFRSFKAAACWYLRNQLEQLLSQQDRFQREKDHGITWLRCVEQIEDLEQVYEAVYAYRRTVPSPLEGFLLPVGESKKKDLKVITKKFPDWMKRMRDGMATTRYIDALRALELIGCRPHELEQGVTVSQSGPSTVTFTVLGAKVTKLAGQPWRKISMSMSRLPLQWIERLQVNQSFIIKIDSKDGLRKSLQRISNCVLKGVPFATAYVYRHRIATLLRDSGQSMEEIGAFLGHSVAETQREYGFRRGGGRKKMPAEDVVDSVATARKVRPVPKNRLNILLKNKAGQFKFK